MLEETCLHRVYTSLLVNMDCPSNSVMQTEAMCASCSASLFRIQSLGKTKLEVKIHFKCRDKNDVTVVLQTD